MDLTNHIPRGSTVLSKEVLHCPAHMSIEVIKSHFAE